VLVSFNSFAISYEFQHILFLDLLFFHCLHGLWRISPHLGIISVSVCSDDCVCFEVIIITSLSINSNNYPASVEINASID